MDRTFGFRGLVWTLFRAFEWNFEDYLIDAAMTSNQRATFGSGTRHPTKMMPSSKQRSHSSKYIGSADFIALSKQLTRQRSRTFQLLCVIAYWGHQIEKRVQHPIPCDSTSTAYALFLNFSEQIVLDIDVYSTCGHPDEDVTFHIV